MDRLSNLTQADIKNGALTRMLAGAGIPDVSEYVKQFHTKTEHVLLQELESQDSYSVNSEERVITPIDVQSWIMSFRPCLNDSVQITSNEPQAKQPPLPSDVQSWITGLRLRLDDPIESSVPKSKPEPYRPTDLNSWMQHMAPVHLHSDTPPSATAPIVPEHSSSAVTGDLTSWLTDWSKSLAELPPPASLDSWLQGLVPNNMHEPLNSSTTPKGRLNSYLNAAQKVLSEHGYQVDNNAKPAGLPPAKAGMFGNVKQMYFLVSLVSSPVLALSISLSLVGEHSGRRWTRTTIERSRWSTCRSCCKRWVWVL